MIKAGIKTVVEHISSCYDGQSEEKSDDFTQWETVSCQMVDIRLPLSLLSYLCAAAVTIIKDASTILCQTKRGPNNHMIQWVLKFSNIEVRDHACTRFPQKKCYFFTPQIHTVGNVGR